MTCPVCKGAPYPWNCERCNPLPPKPKKHGEDS